MIVVTGVSGQLGRQIVEELLRLLPAAQVAASTRDPHKVADLTKQGLRVRRGDFADPASLASAFEGASQLMLVSSNAESYGGAPVEQHRAAIDAARSAGVRRIVYTSHMAASASSAFTPMHTHAATEEVLGSSGLAWTALRNGFYASTVPTLIGDAATSGILPAPQDGKVAWTARADLAAAAAAILTQEGRFEGSTPPLTASEALDLDDVANIFSGLHGTAVDRQIITDDEYAQRLTTRGIPPAIIAITLGLYRAARAGEFSSVGPTLEALLGRKPKTLRELLSGAKPAA